MSEVAKHWLCIYFIYAKNNEANFDFENYLFNGIPPISNQWSKDILEIKELIDNIKNNTTSDMVDSLIIYNEARYLPTLSDKTTIFKIANKTNSIQIEKLSEIDTINYEMKVIDIVNSLKEIKLPVYKYRFMITWDHGSVFGINSQSHINTNYLFINNFDILRSRTPRISNVCEEIAREPIRRRIRDMITNEELAVIIKDGIGKIDLLVMYNCTMMNVNTGYALYKTKKVALWVAPQAGIDIPGYSFDKVLPKLNNQPTMTPNCLAKTIFSILDANKYSNGVRDWSIFCYDLTQFDSIIETIIKIKNKLDTAINNNLRKKELKDCLKKCFPFDSNTGTSNYMKDLIVVLETLSNGNPIWSKILMQEINKIKRDSNNLIKYRHIGSYLYHTIPMQNQYGTNAAPSGLSIFFPDSEDQIKHEIFQYSIADNATNQSAFFKEVNWLTLICRIIS